MPNDKRRLLQRWDTSRLDNRTRVRLSYERMFPKALILVTVIGLAVGVFARPSGGAGRAQVYVVRPTDTLWAIAASHYAGDTREAVWTLERRNGLHGTTLV